MCAFAGGALDLHNFELHELVHICMLRPHFGREFDCDEGMTETDAVADRASLVPGAHRLIRAVDNKEGPFSGSLVTYGNSVAVSVTVEQLDGWPGWEYSNAEHVCGVLDIRRRADGHDALLPWCTQRVEAFLGRRQIADAPLTAGELGTLVASVVRGIRELGDDQASAAGDWWLTGDGRPIFVHGDGGEPRVRTAALVERIAQHTVDRATIRILDEAAAAFRQPRHHLDAEQRWEERLFAIAAPRALRLDVSTPEHTGESGPPRVIGERPKPESSALRRRADAAPQRPRWRELAVALQPRASDLVERLGRRRDVKGDNSATPTRRRPLILAGALGVTVLIVGLMWPTSGARDDAEAAARPPAPAATDQSEADPSSEKSADASPAPSPEEPTDPATDNQALLALPALLDAVHECVAASAEVCADAVTANGRVPTDGVASQGADAGSAVLVEDYGDVVVVRLTPVAPEGTEQMLVLERQNELWLLRDVYDVAKQPG